MKEQGCPPVVDLACQRKQLSFREAWVSKLVHVKDEQGLPCGTLSCGRTLNANYEQVSKFDTFDLCKRCRLNTEKDGILKRS